MPSPANIPTFDYKAAQPRYGKAHCSVNQQSGIGQFEPKGTDGKIDNNEPAKVNFSGGGTNITCDEMSPTEAVDLYKTLRELETKNATSGDSFTPSKR